MIVYLDKRPLVINITIVVVPMLSRKVSPWSDTVDTSTHSVATG